MTEHTKTLQPFAPVNLISNTKMTNQKKSFEKVNNPQVSAHCQAKNGNVLNWLMRNECKSPRVSKG
jgi:hypothetical protein